MHQGNLTFEAADEEQSKLVNELKGFDEDAKPIKKVFFKQNKTISQCKMKTLNNFKSKIFPIKIPIPGQKLDPTIFDTP